MNKIHLSKNESTFLLVLAIFGLLIPNGVFLYYFITDSEVSRIALSNPISLVFIVEAFVLMFLFAWLLKKAGVEKPTGVTFIIMSLIGSMVFSVPLAIYTLFKKRN